MEVWGKKSITNQEDFLVQVKKHPRLIWLRRMQRGLVQKKTTKSFFLHLDFLSKCRADKQDPFAGYSGRSLTKFRHLFPVLSNFRCPIQKERYFWRMLSSPFFRIWNKLLQKNIYIWACDSIAYGGDCFILRPTSKEGAGELFELGCEGPTEKPASY